MNMYYLRLELLRQLRRPSSLFFTVAMPVLFYVLFGNTSFANAKAGSGNVNAVILIFMAIYGAAIAAGSAALTVSFERPLGWNRTLRLTPLRPSAYLATKVVNALLGSVMSMLIVYIVALAMGKAHMSASLWLAGLGVGLVCGVMFGALGLLLGCLLKGETAMGVFIPLLLVCSFLSGLFSIPLSGSFFIFLQRSVPLGGAVNFMLALFGGQSATVNTAGGMTVGDWRIWLNIVGWLAFLFEGAAIAYSRDGKRQ